MRKKLLLVLLLFVLVVLLIVLQLRDKGSLIVSQDKMATINIKDIKDSRDIVSGDVVSTPLFTSINPKYNVVKKKETLYCDSKLVGSLISYHDKYSVISVERDGFYKGFEYYLVEGNKCTSLGKIEDVTFSKNTNEAYANKSVYTFFESINDITRNGLLRISSSGITSFDSEKIRFSAPTAYPDGVLLIENYTNLVGFNANDKQILSQDNTNKNRALYALNVVNKSLFVLSKENEKSYIEVYDVNDDSKISKGEYIFRYDVSESFNEFSQEVKVASSDKYASFTYKENTIVVSNDFSKIFTLNGVNNVVSFIGDYAFVMENNSYLIMDLQNNTKENITDLAITNVVLKNKEVIISVLNDNEQYYFKFTLK